MFEFFEIHTLSSNRVNVSYAGTVNLKIGAKKRDGTRYPQIGSMFPTIIFIHLNKFLSI